ncbi:MAG: hypothetical protein Q9219_005647 [cf. Caloplaca sp. 3 TL-2023]
MPPDWPTHVAATPSRVLGSYRALWLMGSGSKAENVGNPYLRVVRVHLNPQKRLSLERMLQNIMRLFHAKTHCAAVDHAQLLEIVISLWTGGLKLAPAVKVYGSVRIELDTVTATVTSAETNIPVLRPGLRETVQQALETQTWYRGQNTDLRGKP